MHKAHTNKRWFNKPSEGGKKRYIIKTRPSIHLFVITKSLLGENGQSSRVDSDPVLLCPLTDLKPTDDTWQRIKLQMHTLSCHLWALLTTQDPSAAPEVATTRCRFST